MTTETGFTVAGIRRELFDSAQQYYEQRAPYGTRGEKEDLVAWSALVSAGVFAHTVAGILRMVEEDHGAGYAAKITEFVVEAAGDGEVAFDANDDLHTTAADAPFASCQFCGEDLAESEPMVPTAQIPEEDIQMWAHANCHARVEAAHAAPSVDAFLAAEQAGRRTPDEPCPSCRETYCDDGKKPCA